MIKPHLLSFHKQLPLATPWAIRSDMSTLWNVGPQKITTEDLKVDVMTFGHSITGFSVTWTLGVMGLRGPLS